MSNLARIRSDEAVPVAPPPEISKIAPADQVSFKTWLAVIGSTVGAFLAILNIQVVNAALADIQGGIGAGVDTGGWISTSYLIGEIIVIPLTGWMAQVFSLRRYMLTSAVLFLALSVACASASTLGEMIAYRALQGFAGGVLIPLSFTIIMTMLPKAKQPIGLALFALSATFAPAIGPTIGGWLNDTLSWHYIFYVNLIPGVAMLAMLWPALEPAPMKLSLLKKGDWLGIATMAVGLAALQTVLEEGNRHDWLGSPMIVWLSAIALVALCAFILIELRVKEPLVKLRLLADRNFGLGNLAVMVLGVLLYGSIFVLPLYLSQTQGYNAMQIGEVLAWTGLPQLLLIPFMPALMKRVKIKFLIMIGFSLFAMSNFMNIFLSHDVAGDQLILPNIVRAIGQALVLTPLTAATTAAIAPKDAAAASGLFNMLRNLGGAIGIAGLQTFITKREQFHSNILSHAVSSLDPETGVRLARLQDYFMAHGVADAGEAAREAIVAVGRAIRSQAFIMSFADTFMLLGVVSLLAVAVVLFLRPLQGPASAAGH